jgi:hypothetical protein
MSDDVHIRDTVKYTDYKRFGTQTKIMYGNEEVKKEDNQQSAPANTPPKPK